MAPRSVLVAFSSRTGSTAGTAAVIANELHRAGLAVDLRPAAEVDDIALYDAIVLGSGVFVASRGSDGSGFLARFGATISPRPVWLFCVGPIGRSPADGSGTARRPGREYGAVAVARSINARGVAAFGTAGLGSEADAVQRLVPVDPADVRVWARAIAADIALNARVLPVAPRPEQGRRHRASRAHRPALAATG